MAKTPPRIARLHSNLVQSLTTADHVYYKCSRSKVRCQGHSVKGQSHSLT